MNGEATLRSSQELAIADLMQDVANELLHVGFVYSFIKISNSFSSGLINLYASIEVSVHFQENNQERYSHVP